MWLRLLTVAAILVLGYGLFALLMRRLKAPPPVPAGKVRCRNPKCNAQYSATEATCPRCGRPRE